LTGGWYTVLWRVDRRLKRRWHHRLHPSHSSACCVAHTEQLAIVNFLIRLCNSQLLSMMLYPCRSSLCGNYRARATLVPWTAEKLVWAAVADSHDHTFCSLHVQNTACALLFTLFSAQFLLQFLSNGGDRGLRVRVITAAAVRLWCLLVCVLVTSWPPLCDKSTAWRVDRVTSWPVTSWLCDELTGSLSQQGTVDLVVIFGLSTYIG